MSSRTSLTSYNSKKFCLSETEIMPFLGIGSIIANVTLPQTGC